VEDSGPGKPKKYRNGLFDRFHRAIDDGHGAGLGLAIASPILRPNGGAIVSSDSRFPGAASGRII